MLYRVGWNNAKVVIASGVILTLLGVVIISPVVALLIKAIGWLLIALGLIVVALGIGSWALGDPPEGLSGLAGFAATGPSSGSFRKNFRESFGGSRA